MSVDRTDAGVKLGVIEHAFDGSEIDVCVWVGRIKEAEPTEGMPRVEGEGELLAAGGPDATTSDMRNADGDGDDVVRGACKHAQSLVGTDVSLIQYG